MTDIEDWDYVLSLGIDEELSSEHTFSYSFEMPYRIDFFGDEVESIRVFDIETQLSKEKRSEVEIIPDLNLDKKLAQVSLLEFIPKETWITFNTASFVRERINILYDEALVKANEGGNSTPDLHKNRITGDEFMKILNEDNISRDR